MAGKQVKLFLVEGSVGKLTTAEITNWTGHVLKGRRAELATIRKRPEADRTGVYILLGDDESGDGERRAYIGQTDTIAERLRTHDSGEKAKTFWDEVLVITSKDSNLTSAHVRYLENRLIEIAVDIGRFTLENGNSASTITLPEADASDMEEFIKNLEILLPVLGVNIIRGRSAHKPRGQSPDQQKDTGVSLDSPIFRLVKPKWGIDASAQVIDGEFTVLKDSIVRSKMHQNKSNIAETTRAQWIKRDTALQRFVADESISPTTGGLGYLTRDIVFSSPSAAAAIFQGRASANGRVEWVSSDGLTYSNWESQN